MTDTKNDCIDSMTRALEKAAIWRRTLAVRFPGDVRNLRAAAILQTLASEVANIRDDQWQTLSQHFHWSSERWQTALNDTVRAVGFHIRAGKLDAFLNALLQRLTLTVGAAA